jgi:hypothetical protein
MRIIGIRDDMELAYESDESVLKTTFFLMKKERKDVVCGYLYVWFILEEAYHYFEMEEEARAAVVIQRNWQWFYWETYD